MRMHGERNVFSRRAHLDGERRFGDQLARARTADADAQHAFALGSMIILVTPSVRSNDNARPEAAHGNFTTSCDAFGFRLGLGQAAPRQLGVRVKTTAGITTFSDVLKWPAMVSTAMRPSLCALCASMMPPAMSPMA